MRPRILPALSAAVLALAVIPAAPARAVIPVGQPANPFTKDTLVGTSVGPAVSLSDYHGQVKLLFVLGYN